MTKLYYDDPLKAAWMAREFGVKYTNQKGKVYGGKKAKRVAGKITIHPDSYDIFEPQEGDVVSWDNKPMPGKKYAVLTGKSYEDDFGLPFVGTSEGNIFGDCIQEIILRNNKQFFTPEME